MRGRNSHNFGERAAVIPDITTRDVVSSGIAENLPEDFPSRTGGWYRGIGKFPLRFCCLFLPVGLAEVRERPRFPQWGQGVTGEGDGYGEMVRPKGPCHIGEEMPAEKGDIWRGGLALGGESGREILVRNSELQTFDCPVEILPSGRCLVISGSGEPGGMVGVKVAKLHLVSTVLQMCVKVKGIVPRAEGCRGM